MGIKEETGAQCPPSQEDWEAGEFLFPECSTTTVHNFFQIETHFIWTERIFFNDKAVTPSLLETPA